MFYHNFQLYKTNPILKYLLCFQDAEVGRKRFWRYFSTEEWNKRQDVFEMMEELKQMRIDEGDEWMVPMDQFSMLWAAVVGLTKIFLHPNHTEGHTIYYSLN